MTRILKPVRVQETNLWSVLDKLNCEDACALSANVVSLCEEATDRMKAMYAYAPQYTLHDDRHLLRTTELMALVLGTQVEQLNALEIALLILSAFFHDQGMVLSSEEYSSLKSDENFQLVKSNWILEHPNYGETAAQLNSSVYTSDRKTELAMKLAELDEALLTDYIRKTHGQRSADFIRTTYQHDKRLEVQKANLAPFLATLCESHTLNHDALRSLKSFRHDEQIGTYVVNFPFLAVALRLADILDFDRDRTPEVLLKSIHFTSDISLGEWEKHRSVEGWQISPELIRFTVKCTHPAYEAATRKYMDWIDMELTTGHEMCREQPRYLNGYNLNLPSLVDRSRIEPLDASYRFYDLEFSLSRDDVVRLLMTDKLYGNEHLCIRELLQNSLDALRYRKALFSEASSLWNEGRVAFRHYVNEDGYEVLECKDNGTGMDEEIVRNYFIRVGRSYYRSPVFEREINRLKSSGNDFDPCSKFGIGFMSCFMLGDRITISTRRDYGLGRQWGVPLLIEIHGLGGLIVVREGSPNQPIGTTVSIVSRQRPSFLDRWTDKVKLCTVLKGYALANEFPIHANCEVPELKETLTIPVEIEKAPTALEIAKVDNYICIEQDISEVTSLLRGYVRESFLSDDAGLPCLANDEAEWIGHTEASRKEWRLRLLHGDQEIVDDDRRHCGVQVCMDGILVGGSPGRPSSYKEGRSHLGERCSRIYSPSPALIDARGELKPEITPARTPPEFFGAEMPPGWRRLNDAFRQGLGLLWGKLTKHLDQGLPPEIFWKISVVHQISVEWIPANQLWESLSVPVTDGNEVSWQLIRELGELSICQGDSSVILSDKRGRRVEPDSALKIWEQQGEEHTSLAWAMNSIVLLMSCLDVRDDRVILLPSSYACSISPLALYAGAVLFMEYGNNASDALSVQAAHPTANRSHPLVKRAHQSRYASAKTDLQTFASGFVSCISQSLSTKEQTPSLDKPGYWQKRVGHLYFSVHWEQYDASLKPPYKLWSKDKGWFLFEEADFARWRDVPTHFD